MSIELPTWPAPQSAESYFIDAGGWQESALAAADATRIDRLGDRHGLAVAMPPMRLQDDPRGIHARQWISRLKRGMSEGVRLRFPQPDFIPPTGLVLNASVRTAAIAQSTALQLKGFPATQPVLLEGQFLSIVRAATGRRSLHSVNADSQSDALGNVDVSVHPRLRAPIAVNDVVLVGRPEIEGRLLGDRSAWNLEMARTVGLSFEIVEL